MDTERAVRSGELIFNGYGESCSVGGADLQRMRRELFGRWSWSSTDAERAVWSVELIFNGCGESCSVGGADLQWMRRELCGRWSKCYFLYLPHAGDTILWHDVMTCVDPMMSLITLFKELHILELCSLVQFHQNVRVPEACKGIATRLSRSSGWLTFQRSARLSFRVNATGARVNAFFRGMMLVNGIKQFCTEVFL